MFSFLIICFVFCFGLFFFFLSVFFTLLTPSSPSSTQLGTSKPSPTTGLEEELKEAQEQYQLAKEQLINHQTHTPEEVAAHFLGHAQGPKHLCNVEPLPYFDEEKRGGGGGREGGGGHFGQVRKLEGECELVEKRMRELKGELGGLEGRSKQISEFVADSGVACSVLDKLVAEDDEEEEEEGEEEGKRKRKRKEEETPRTSARRKVAVGLGQK